MMRSWIFY